MAIMDYTVKIDGKELGELSIRLSNITLSQPLGGHHKISMECLSLSSHDDWGGGALDTLRKALGKDLEIEIKWDEGQEKVNFRGIVTAIQTAFDHLEGYSLKVEGSSPTIQMDGPPRNRLWIESTCSDILKDVAGEYGDICQVKASTSRVYGTTVQHDESDFAFIQRLCQQEKLWAWYDGAKFQIADSPSGSARVISMQPGGSGAMVRFAIKQGTAPGKVLARSWDRIGMSSLEQPSDDSASSGSLHPNVKEAVKASDLLFKSMGNMILERHPTDLKGLEADLESRRRSWAGGLVMAEGESFNPGVISGGMLELSDIGVDAGKYIVTDVTHYIQGGETNYRNEFTAVPEDGAFPPRPHQRPHAPSLWGAIVINTEDPDALGRVQVVFHHSVGTAKGEECPSPWIRVAQGHSGKEWGTYVLPEIGDEVIVAALDGNQEDLVVIGSLPQGNGPNEMGPLAAANDAVGSDASLGMAKVFLTKSGNQILIQDTNGSETIEISSPGAQNQIRLTLDGNPRIELTTDGEVAVDAKGAISLKSDADISLEAKGKIELKSKSDLLLEAKGKADLKATMAATVKGMEVTLDGSGKVACNMAGVEIKGTLVRIN